MKPVIIWVTGRAATGKSTVISTVKAALNNTPAVFSDEELLHELAHADTTHEHHWHPHGDHRMAFRGGWLFDEGLRVISRNVLKIADRGGLALVEMARGSSAEGVDVTYRRALQLIHPAVWAHSTVYRLNASVDEQAPRNAQRGGTTPDDIMATLYASDDPESFTRAGIPIVDIPAGTAPQEVAEAILTRLRQTITARR